MKLAALLLISLATIGMSAATDCPLSDAFERGKVQSDDVEEASGLVASRMQPGVLYTQNDSGNENAVYAMWDDGTTIGAAFLDGVENIDWEDLAIGAGPEPGVDYIYVADFGNNDYDRSVVYVYRFPEPNVDDFDAADGELTIPASDITKISLASPFAPEEDMETLMYDPASGDLYIVTKNHEAPEANIYRFTPPEESNATPLLLNLVGRLARQMVVGGDITPDGSRILLRGGDNSGAWQWARLPGSSVEEALTTRESCDLELADEKQGEAIAAAPDNSGFYTTSEGKNEPIYFYGFF